MADQAQTNTKKPKKTFVVTDLKDAQQKDFEYVQNRIAKLKKSRENHYGHNLDTIFRDADRDYIPHRLRTKTKRVVATDEDKGWRGNLVTLGDNDWQSDVSQANPYVKIQTALSILVDQNPGAVMTPTTKKYVATTEIIKQLYQRSWEYAKSKAQLKLFVFNLAKYGWATARTYPLRVTRTVKVITKYDNEDPENSTYETKEVVEYNDVMRENLDPRNVWIDDMAKPNNARSVNDWVFRKVYDYDLATEEFGKYKRWEMTSPGGNISETLSETKETKEPANPSNLIEILFYENKAKDLFTAIANGVPIIMEPLPIADSKGVKRLSLWQTYWNLRHSESPYGIGIYESIRYDQGMLDRIRNMTVDQLVLSIYKMFFFQGTQSLTDTGDIKVTPGIGKQVLDPKNINWMEVPGPGKDAYLGIDMFRKDVDEASGITDPLLGQITGKTAFEIAQAKESALKRMKNPLDNILEALNDEGYITISLMQLLYSIPEVHEIADPRLIEDYLAEIGGDQELYNRVPQMDDNGAPQLDDNGNNVPDKFQAKVYREFPLNLSKDDKGNLIETPETEFFRVKPSCLPWEGLINIKSQSLLSPSQQIQKAQELEMFNVLIPVMQATNQERMLLTQSGQPAGIDDLTNGKTIKEIIKLYDKDPRDIIPDSWLQDSTKQPAPSLTLPANHPAAQGAQPGSPMQPPMPPQGQMPPSPQQQAPQAQTVTPPKQGFGANLMQSMKNAFTGTPNAQ